MVGMRSPSLALAISSAAVVLVAGCSSPFSPPAPPSSTAPGSSSAVPSPAKHSDEPLPDPAALLREASATAQVLQSAHLAMSVVGKVAETPVKSLDAELTTNANGSAAKDDSPTPTTKGGKPSATRNAEPGKTAEDGEDGEPEPAVEHDGAAKGTGKVAILGSEIDFKFVVFGGRLYVALPGAAWVDYGPTTRPYSVTSILNPEEGLANVLENFVDPKVEGRETVGDQHTIRVRGKVTPVAVNKFMPQLGATERMPATVWIQEGGDRQVVELSLEPSKGNFVQMVFSEWNKPVTVEKPAGV